MKWEDKKDTLDHLINVEGVSYEEIGKMFKVSGSAIKKAARTLGIELPKRREINPSELISFANRKKTRHICQNPNCGKEFDHKASGFNKYCSLACQQEHRHIQLYNKILEGDETIMRGNYSPKRVKDFIIAEQDNKEVVGGSNLSRAQRIYEA